MTRQARVLVCRRHAGVALVIALLMSAVLSLFALQVSLVTKDQINAALDAQTRADNLLVAHSLESELTFALLTEDWVTAAGVEQPTQWQRVWSFDGTPFEVDGSTLSLQDESGLLAIPQPGESAGLFAALLKEIGIPSIRADRIARDLEQMQFTPGALERGRIPVQSLHELVDFSSLAPDELRALRRLTTLFPLSHFNPDTAPEPVFRVSLQGKDVDTLIRLRSDRVKNAANYLRELRLVSDDFVFSSVGPAIRWSIETSRLGQKYSRSGTMIVRPYAFEPVSVWSYSRLDR